MESYDTLVEALNALRDQGYTEDFNLQTDCIACHGGEIKIFPQDFEVDKFFRFEGETNPADSSILYAISSNKFGLKGVLVNAYGTYADDATGELLSKLGGK